MSFRFAGRVSIFSFSCILAFFSVAAVSFAQSSNGTLVGALTDPTGAAIVGAHVNVISAQYDVPHEATTDAVGTYRIEDLQPGTYSVTFTASGFQVLQVAQVVIQGSVATTVNGALRLGATTTSVTVEAGANQVIDTQSGQLGESLGQGEIENLPYSSLNPAQLALTLPGVQEVPGFVGNGAVTGNWTNGYPFSVNGTRPRANNFLIDGQDDNDNSIEGQAYQPDNDQMFQDFTILTNSYSAQYGRGGGSVSNYITKSGTNSFHGDLWEINQDSAFASNDAGDKFIGVFKRPLLVQNTYGFDVGGPVVRDKLFFFATAQWNPQAQRATGPSFAIPDANGIATLTTLAQTNPRAKIFLGSLGGLVSPSRSPSIPCGAGTVDEQPGPGFPCIEMNLFARNGVKEEGKERMYDFKLDWHPSENDSISGSYLHSYTSLTPDLFGNPGALQPFDSYQSGPSAIFRSHWAHTFSPKLLNEMRFSYTSIDFTFAFLPSSLSNSLSSLPYLTFPTIAIPNIGLNDEFPQGRGHKTNQLQDMVTYSAGNHTFTAGADITFESVRDVLPLDTRGSITYYSSKPAAYDPFGNFLSDFTGASGSISKTFGNPILAPATTMYAPYLQDTWRVKDNLTLSLGLRYEYWGTPENVLQYPAISSGVGFGLPGIPVTDFFSLYSAQQIADKDNFAPRIGFAYVPHSLRHLLGDGETVIRGGYGIFYDGLFTNIPDNAAETAPNATGGTITGGAGQGQGMALEEVIAIAASPNPDAAVETIVPNLINPVTQQWNVDIQRSLPAKFVLTASYVGTRGTHLFANQDWNPTVAYGPRMNPNFNEVTVRTNAAQSWYNAGQLELERTLGSSLTFRASYTYSKFLDDASEIITTTGSTSYAQILNCQKCDWGPSTFDRRHRFVVSYVWQMPVANSNWVTRALTDRWQWSGIATFETGTPNNVLDGFDNIGNGHPGSRPNLGNPKQPVTAIGIDEGAFTNGVETGTDYALTQDCLNNGNCIVEPSSSFRFIIPASGPGDLGRNAAFGPGQVYFDTGVQRDFPFRVGRLENQNIMFRTEFLNAFNHPNLYTPTYSMISPLYADAAATIEGQRVIRFWLKYSF